MGAPDGGPDRRVRGRRGLADLRHRPAESIWQEVERQGLLDNPNVTKIHLDLVLPDATIKDVP